MEKRSALAVSIAVASYFVAVTQLQAQTFSIDTSPYWCAKLQGSMSNNLCSLKYAAQPGSCEIFEQANVDAPDLIEQLQQVQSAPVCVASVVNEAKANTLKLRIQLMGFVTAGLEENVNDPIHNPGFRPVDGKPTFWPSVSYFLYQCVVETCTSK